MAKNDIDSITELERRSGISRQVLDRFIKGKTQRLDFDTVIKLCDVFNCEVGDLIYVDKDDHK
ncbi:helix-turn-helix domain-containing protein [Virgibacillus sp. CBA3643]|uniref:helix-turn-helix domain-containing protein n=1 Tax=Virgibacillus sp. CBA3643 TaxID=2942278 RepID=UPI0035A3C1DF